MERRQPWSAMTNGRTNERENDVDGGEHSPPTRMLLCALRARLCAQWCPNAIVLRLSVCPSVCLAGWLQFSRRPEMLLLAQKPASERQTKLCFSRLCSPAHKFDSFPLSLSLALWETVSPVLAPSLGLASITITADASRTSSASIKRDVEVRRRRQGEISNLKKASLGTAPPRGIARSL